MALTTDSPAASHQPGMPGARHTAATAAPLLIAALAGLAAVCWVALSTSGGRRLDQRAMLAVLRNRSASADRLVDLLAQLSIGWAAVALAVIVIIALLRARVRVALATVVLVIGANVTTQVLKRLILDRPELGLGNGTGAPNSLPSGHTTVIFSLVLALVLAAPHGLRWLTALVGSVIGAMTGWTTMAAGWHRPSDVVAAMLVAVAWAALTSALVAGSPHHRLPRGAGGLCLAILGGLASAAAMLFWSGSWSGATRTAVLTTVAAIAGVSALGTGFYARLVSRTSD